MTRKLLHFTTIILIVLARQVLACAGSGPQTIDPSIDPKKAKAEGPASANKNDPQAPKLSAGPFWLKCGFHPQWQFKDGKQVFVDGKPVIVLNISVTNDTNYTVPTDKTINWSVNPEIKGSFKLRTPLKQGDRVLREVGKIVGFSIPGGAFNPKAWYYY